MDRAPDLQAAPVRFVRAGIAALLIALPTAVIPWGDDGYNYIKALLTYGLVAGALAGWAVSYGLTRTPAWRPTHPEPAVWAFVLAVMLSTSLSADAQLSFLGGPRRYEGFFTLLTYVALYFLGGHFFGSRRGVDRLLAAAALGGVAAIGYGLLQPFVPPLFEGEAFIRQWYDGLGIPRLSSTVGGPVVFGGYLALLVPLLLAFGSAQRGPLSLALLLAAAGGLVTLVLTLTRGAWIAAAAGTVLFVAFGAAHSGRRRQISALILATLAVGTVVAITVARAPRQIGMRVTSAVATDSGSVAQRLYIWQRTLGLIRARPLLGWGPETLREVFPYDRQSMVRYFGLRPAIIDRAHNDLLQVAVSTGVPGAGAYGVFWGLVLLSGVRLVRRTAGTDRVVTAGVLGSITAFIVQAQFAFSAVAVSPIAWLLSGALCGWEAEDERRTAA